MPASVVRSIWRPDGSQKTCQDRPLEAAGGPRWESDDVSALPRSERPPVGVRRRAPVTARRATINTSGSQKTCQEGPSGAAGVPRWESDDVSVLCEVSRTFPSGSQKTCACSSTAGDSTKQRESKDVPGEATVSCRRPQVGVRRRALTPAAGLHQGKMGVR